MRDVNIQSRLRRKLVLLVPAGLTASLLRGQSKDSLPSTPLNEDGDDNRNDLRLPNGKKQIDEILKADYEKNLNDARELTNLARSLEEDLEKNEAFVFSLSTLKKLDDMEKLTKRIRARMKRL